ncbi:MAG: leucyl/phenylalanyl-tRNA--protein transferase [Brachymonas sp.]|nr:leucyl/phenylalanyl-tRNA--protein transferase [Brachymonas sp.]
MTAERSLPWLQPHEVFPPPESALDADSPFPGLLAAGGVLDADTLAAAYAQGIFPWSSEGEPLLWWSTNPRMVLQPAQFRLHDSLRRTLRQFRQRSDAHIAMDTAFEAVIRACAEPRTGHSGTWIHEDLINAYVDLHYRGLAHSVETWIGGELVGGLYVVALGRAVFGESMFARQSNASKLALVALVSLCRAHGVEMIDCQQETAHLASLGAAPVPRAEFLASIRRTQHLPAMDWRFDHGLWDQLVKPAS